MEETFNVGNPTRENVDYAFKNLIFFFVILLKFHFFLKIVRNVSNMIKILKSKNIRDKMKM